VWAYPPRPRFKPLDFQRRRRQLAPSSVVASGWDGFRLCGLVLPLQLPSPPAALRNSSFDLRPPYSALPAPTGQALFTVAALAR